MVPSVSTVKVIFRLQTIKRFVEGLRISMVKSQDLSTKSVFTTFTTFGTVCTIYTKKGFNKTAMKVKIHQKGLIS
jgi:hypothetical protein